jgi:hypothetical protein
MFLEVVLSLALLTVSTVAQYIGFDQLAPFFQAFEWKKKNEWISRINAIVIEVGVLLFAMVSGGSTVWGVGSLLAYFLHDSVHLLLYDHDITNYIHHIIGTAVILLRSTVMTPDQASSTFIAALNLESTGPFINATWLMRAAGYKEHPAFKYLAGFTLVFFGLMRVLLFPWLMYNHMDKGTAIMFSPLLVLNVYWFYKIIGMAQKAFATKSGGDRDE